MDVSRLHMYIKSGDKDKIIIIIEENPSEKIGTFEGVSAIKQSLICSRISHDLDIYELLVAFGFKLGDNESLEEIMRTLELDDFNSFASKLGEIHRKYVKETQRHYLFRLNLVSKLAHNTPEEKRHKFEKLIEKTYEKLAKIPEAKKIMQYIVNTKG